MNRQPYYQLLEYCWETAQRQDRGCYARPEDADERLQALHQINQWYREAGGRNHFAYTALEVSP